MVVMRVCCTVATTSAVNSENWGADRVVEPRATIDPASDPTNAFVMLLVISPILGVVIPRALAFVEICVCVSENTAFVAAFLNFDVATSTAVPIVGPRIATLLVTTVVAICMIGT
jgi:hypothetical protein